MPRCCATPGRFHEDDPQMTQEMAVLGPRVSAGMAEVRYSVIIPVYNEEANVDELYSRLARVLGGDTEFLFVDDGSTDGTFARLRAIAAHDARLRVLSFRRNFGQTAALSAGIDHARGEIIIPMDGDLQNDPQDIPRLLEKLAEGYDVVSGWRKNRQDSFQRRLPSIIANRLTSWISGVKLH